MILNQKRMPLPAYLNRNICTHPGAPWFIDSTKEVDFVSGRCTSPTSQNTEVISFLNRNDNIEDNSGCSGRECCTWFGSLDDASRASLECKKCVVGDAHERFIIALRQWQYVNVHDFSIFSPRQFGLLGSNHPDHDEGWRRISHRFLSFHEMSTYSGKRYEGSLDSTTVIISVHLKPGVGHSLGSGYLTTRFLI